MKPTEKEQQWLLEEKYNSQISEEYKADLARLEAGEPLAYVIGFVHFLDCKIDLSQKPLIPRPETEYWTELAIKDIKSSKLPEPIVLDLFSGSGCIGTAVLKHLPNAQVTLGEIEPKLKDQIKFNLDANHIARDRYRVETTDVFSNIEGKFDFILANPPYISKDDSEVEESVSSNEPYGALFADNDGLSIIEQFLEEAQRYLNKGGKIYLEFGTDQAKQINTLAEQAGFICELRNDQFDRPRFAILTQ